MSGYAMKFRAVTPTSRSMSIRTPTTFNSNQDTNDIQFKLLQKLCTAHENLAVVGDDDQSIYGWRGARIENILNFKDQFSNVKFIKLEQNYRSTDEILNAANELISHNKNRLGKSLTRALLA